MLREESASRGRPRDLAKREAIVDAGRALFAAGGTRQVTVGQVLSRACVSRGTFYANFADTDALLEAVVWRESDRIVAGAVSSNAGKEQLRSVLLRFGIGLLTFLCDPEMQSFEQRLTAEADTNPELARRFFEAGPSRAHRCLISVVKTAIERGELVSGNAAELVGDLIGLWQGFHRLELMFRVVPFPTPAQLEQRSARGVDLFLKLYGRNAR